MKPLTPLFPKLLPFAFAAFLGGCAAGGGETGTGLNTPPPKEPVVASGTITGFGSVYVNGVHFETSNSGVSLDGATADETQLKIGMVVKVRGAVNDDGTTGTASLIEFEDEVEGVVSDTSALDPITGLGSITVMGQNIIIDKSTVIDYEVGTGPIVQNNIVEVSGHATGTGDIYATLITVKELTYTAGTREIELKGVVSSLTSSSFSIGTQIVDYDSAQIEDGSLADGALVEIKSLSGFDNSNGHLLADEIKIKSASGKEIEGEEGQEIELEGVVTNKVDMTHVIVNGYTVLVSDSSTLMEGDKIEIKGSFDAYGNIVAKSTETRYETELVIQADVTNKNSINNLVTLLGTDFAVNNLTRFNDDRDGEHYFNFSGLQTTDWVEIQAYKNSSTWVALSIERIEPGNIPTIEGTVSSPLTNQIIGVNGFDINVSNVTDLTIVSQLQVGDEVSVELQSSTLPLTATLVEN